MDIRKLAVLRGNKVLIEPSLKLYMPFDEGSGSIAKDHSQFGNDGELIAAEWGIIGVEFDGTSSYINCGGDSSLDFSDAITIEAWMKTSTPQTDTYIISKPTLESGSNGVDFSAGSQSNELTFRTVGLTPHEFKVNASIYDNVWHHIVGVYTGAQHIIYIDGVLISSQNATGSIDTNANNLYIGRFGTFGAYFNGSVDGVKIYDRAVSALEVWNTYEVERDRYSV